MLHFLKVHLSMVFLHGEKRIYRGGKVGRNMAHDKTVESVHPWYPSEEE